VKNREMGAETQERSRQATVLRDPGQAGVRKGFNRSLSSSYSCLWGGDDGGKDRGTFLGMRGCRNGNPGGKVVTAKRRKRGQCATRKDGHEGKVLKKNKTHKQTKQKKKKRKKVEKGHRVFPTSQKARGKSFIKNLPTTLAAEECTIRQKIDGWGHPCKRESNMARL